jgi:hypothetical protein
MANVKEAAYSFREKAKQLSALTQVAILVAASLLPMMLMGRASADQLQSRKVTISKSAVGSTAQGQSVEYDFQFSWTISTAVQGVIFEFCDAPLGTCTLPTGMNVNRTLTTLDGHTNFPTNATSFSEFTTDNTGDCDDIAGVSTDTQYCISRTEATSGTGTNATVDLGGITNPTSIDTVYIRVSLYSDTSFATLVHTGTVAAAIVDQLTVNGRVQERLDFCVASLGDADALPGDVATCSALSDQNVDIGIIDESSVAVSPVDNTPTNGADDDYGILMVNTNASAGVALSYYAEDPSAVSGGDTHQLKNFRVVPSDCSATVSATNDQCFVAALNAGSGSVITLGNELFGVYIPCVDTTQGTTTNLNSADADYDGNDDTITSAANCETETFTSGTAVVGWNSGSSADALISSSSVVNDEIVKLRFAATASPTTPSGNYTAVTTYIATATF